MPARPAPAAPSAATFDGRPPKTTPASASAGSACSRNMKKARTRPTDAVQTRPWLPDELWLRVFYFLQPHYCAALPSGRWMEGSSFIGQDYHSCEPHHANAPYSNIHHGLESSFARKVSGQPSRPSATRSHSWVDRSDNERPTNPIAELPAEPKRKKPRIAAAHHRYHPTIEAPLPCGKPAMLILPLVNAQFRRVCFMHSFWKTLAWHYLLPIADAKSLELHDRDNPIYGPDALSQFYQVLSGDPRRLAPVASIQLDLAPFGRSIDLPALSLLFSRLSSKPSMTMERIRSVVLNCRWDTITDSAVIEFVAGLPRLESLFVVGVRSSHVLSGLSSESLKRILKENKRLRRKDADGSEQRGLLRLGLAGYGYGSFSSHTFLGFLALHPFLQQLSIGYMRGGVNLTQIAALAPHLESLCIQFEREKSIDSAGTSAAGVAMSAVTTFGETKPKLVGDFSGFGKLRALALVSAMQPHDQHCLDIELLNELVLTASGLPLEQLRLPRYVLAARSPSEADWVNQQKLAFWDTLGTAFTSLKLVRIDFKMLVDLPTDSVLLVRKFLEGLQHLILFVDADDRPAAGLAPGKTRTWELLASLRQSPSRRITYLY
ncbi:uncharacterized protein BJ171DRAFT_511594 [Polychytrium aggregatum]|uniref:uncharacterized protein n=1 Tax=Polychytrium aggregatum TaxID=110093 RepID=UPI0022FE1B15|nr:uncharacterized protein BJ171DRAFT_511594 [Polychytrium aggregatum]KAI9203029.1 hypothetical protein BJ171DRAFT_511594 [Polychytrium aggregatum]